MRRPLADHPIIAMIHLKSLKVSSSIPLETVIKDALSEVKTIEEAGFGAILVENFQDAPFVKYTVDEIVLTKLGIVMHEILEKSKIPIGVNILRNGGLQAMKLATALRLSFIRCNVWEAAYITDQGIIEGIAEQVMAYKMSLNSTVEVFADIFVKHASPMGQFSIEEAAENALKRGQANRLIISGASTGAQPDIKRLKSLNKIGIKPLIGSGLTLDNLDKLAPHISGAIVGTSIKQDSDVLKSIDLAKAKNLVSVWKKTFNN